MTYKVKSNGTEHNLVEEKETYIGSLTSANIAAQIHKAVRLCLTM